LLALRLRPSKRGHDEVLRRAAEQGLERARRSNDPGAEAAVGVFEEAIAVLRRSQAILDGVADGVYVTNPAGQIRLWNRSAERLTGCRESKALGRTCRDILHLHIGDDPLDCSRGCALLALKGADEVEVEADRVISGTKTQNLLVGASAVRDSEHEVVEIVHSIRDITALKLADEAKTMFLATASHELKTPLTVILGFSQLLLDDVVKDTERQTALEAIQKRARELSRIVDRLLMTGRIEAGRIALNLGVVDLRPIAVERATALSGAADRRVLVDVGEAVPPIVGDPDAITTVLDHLLDNAVKYSPGGEDVVVALRAINGRVEIEVRDAGIGMSADEAKHCFERFWQAESSDVRQYGGTGVGLYIVRSLVEGMNGEIDVRSMPGQGSTFTTSFRAASEQDVALLENPAPVEPGVGKQSMIHEFMRQIGVPSGGGT
jgi:PAS domain S-box-containing protein